MDGWIDGERERERERGRVKRWVRGGEKERERRGRGKGKDSEGDGGEKEGGWRGLVERAGVVWVPVRFSRGKRRREG